MVKGAICSHTGIEINLSRFLPKVFSSKLSNYDDKRILASISLPIAKPRKYSTFSILGTIEQGNSPVSRKKFPSYLRKGQFLAKTKTPQQTPINRETMP